MNKNLVVKDNALINASYNLELIEQRLILLAVAQSRNNSKPIDANTKVTISISDYIDTYSVQGRSVYENIKQACKTLFERQFTYAEKQSKGVRVATSRWVSEIAYNDTTASIDLTFSSAVVPLITMLEHHFTSYNLEQVANLTSKYAVRLYEMLSAWKNAGRTPMMTLDELRHRLAIADDEYTRIDALKNRVVDSSINQINTKTNLKITYEQHKQGRKIVGFTFTVKDTKPKRNKPMKAKQIAKYSTELAHMNELGYLARAGESYESLATRIAQELADSERLEFYKPYLEKLGYQCG